MWLISDLPVKKFKQNYGGRHNYIRFSTLKSLCSVLDFKPLYLEKVIKRNSNEMSTFQQAAPIANGDLYFAVAIVFTVLAGFAVVLRLLTKMANKAPYGADDWCIMAGYALWLCEQGLGIAGSICFLWSRGSEILKINSSSELW
jgi:hypothetical protein